MSRDRKYIHARGRQYGLRRRSPDANRSGGVEQEAICLVSTCSDEVSVVSQAISGAVTPSSGRELLKTETKDATRQSSDKSCSKSEKPNCYQCKYRGEIPGNAHSKCLHPMLNGVTEDPILGLLSMMGSRGFRSMGVNMGDELGHLIGVSGDEHGIRSGWFNWPLNFDPVWLQTCDGFEARGS